METSCCFRKQDISEEKQDAKRLLKRLYILQLKKKTERLREMYSSHADIAVLASTVDKAMKHLCHHSTRRPENVGMDRATLGQRNPCPLKLSVKSFYKHLS